MVREVSRERVSHGKSKVLLSDQYTYGGTMAKGDVDLVVRIKSGPNYTDNILFVTEVKKPSTLEEGLLQNCMELYDAYEKNSVKGEVYGIVICGNQWIYTRYVGDNNEYPMKNWNQSDCLHIYIPNDINNFGDKTKEEVKEITSYIKWIIKSSAEKFDNAIAPKTSIKSPKKRRRGSS
ncbi:hypothetical protein [Cardinium endosymbiont of Culicoides punctatus]|uniref:hypothetical protein n=1 Tax=Cardinium endosymbiont of Culicoides punctatus TaxID=2304601 RepID=UPI001058813F|nr:hypothetical protein [Cardinium endosymbiont of Culicoides punctatus]TDG95052.1 hypothetical protein CCPUN_06380 [Cardinium endosymbiont of Culicoides punctatus]